MKPTIKGEFEVVDILKKTSAQFFKDFKIGDKFELIYEISGRYNRAPDIYIYKDGKMHTNNALQLSKNLENFALIKLN